MKSKLLEDLTAAMRNKDKKKLSVIRMVKGAIQLEEISKKQELNDEEVISIIAKQIKTRKESISEFAKGGRNDLIDSTQEEIDILNKYMPEQMSEEEVIAIIEQVFIDINPTSPRDMGKIMGSITPKVKGKADLGFVNKMIREKLDNL